MGVHMTVPYTYTDYFDSINDSNSNSDSQLIKANWRAQITPSQRLIHPLPSPPQALLSLSSSSSPPALPFLSPPLASDTAAPALFSLSSSSSLTALRSSSSSSLLLSHPPPPTSPLSHSPYPLQLHEDDDDDEDSTKIADDDEDHHNLRADSRPTTTSGLNPRHSPSSKPGRTTATSHTPTKSTICRATSAVTHVVLGQFKTYVILLESKKEMSLYEDLVATSVPAKHE